MKTKIILTTFLPGLLGLLFAATAHATGWTQIGCSSASDGKPKWTQLNQNQGSSGGTTWTKLDGGCLPPQAQAAAAYHQPVHQSYQPPAQVAYQPPVQTYVPPTQTYQPPVQTYVPPVTQPVVVYVPPVIPYQPPPPPPRRVCLHTFQDPVRCVWLTRSGAVAGWRVP